MELTKKTIPELKKIYEEEDHGEKKMPTLRKAEMIEFIQGRRIERSKNVKIKVGSARDLNLIYKYMPDTDYLQHLKEYGWAVVDVPNFDAKKYEEEFFGFLERCCPQFKREDRKTWVTKNLPPNSYGILKSDVGHEPWMWEIRQKCIPIFEEIWKSDDLLCSFDGACILSPEIKVRKSCYIHVDQYRKCHQFDCIQGLVNLHDNGPNDGGFVIIEKSHHRFKEYTNRHPSQYFAWDLADISDPVITENNAVKVCLKAGQIILWDSRCFHANTPPKSEGEHRMCAYVCMQPRINCDSKTLKKRIEYFEKGKMTSHPCYGPWFKSVTGVNRYGKEMNRLEECVQPQLNEKQRKLVGY